ncbi:MAG: DUF2975 domain-containing protein [Bacteroidales bacterium]|jgi:hypothetical protein|nr:DUF2975 domain-containing protein [Bacteroidales bacterium]
MSKIRSKLLTLKGIRTSLDVVCVAIALLILGLVAVSVIDISRNPNSIVGTATIHPAKDPIVLGGDLSSQVEGVNLSLKPNFIEVQYKMLFSQNHTDVIFYRILWFFTLNLPMIFILFILFYLRNIVNSVLKEVRHSQHSIAHYIFSKRNIRRVRYIAFAFILFPLLELSAYWADNLLLQRYFSLKGIDVASIITMGSLSWDYIIIGLAFIVIIEILRRGIALQEENDLTV